MGVVSRVTGGVVGVAMPVVLQVVVVPVMGVVFQAVGVASAVAGGVVGVTALVLQVPDGVVGVVFQVVGVVSWIFGFGADTASGSCKT